MQVCVGSLEPRYFVPTKDLNMHLNYDTCQALFDMISSVERHSSNIIQCTRIYHPLMLESDEVVHAHTLRYFHELLRVQL